MEICDRISLLQIMYQNFSQSLNKIFNNHSLYFPLYIKRNCVTIYVVRNEKTDGSVSNFDIAETEDTTSDYSHRVYFV